MSRNTKINMQAALGAVLLGAAWAWPNVGRDAKLIAHLCGLLPTLAAMLGCLFLLAIATLSGARWGQAAQAWLQTPPAAFAGLALLFVPLALLLPSTLPTGAMSAPQQAWSAPGWFAGRSAVYFILWVGTAELWRRLGAKNLSTRAPALRRLSAAALPMLAITTTLASFDWMMALSAPWQSTALGVYVFAECLVAGVSVVILLAWWHGLRGGKQSLAPPHVRNLGRLLFTFNFFWAYVAISQLLVTVMADLPDEIAWYAPRAQGMWGAASFVLCIGHFAVPFLLLLFERNKRSLNMLAAISAGSLLMQALDLHWLIVPSLPQVQAAPGIAWLMTGGTALLLGALAARRAA